MTIKKAGATCVSATDSAKLSGTGSGHSPPDGAKLSGTGSVHSPPATCADALTDAKAVRSRERARPARPELVEAMMTDCVLLEAARVPDGLGGFRADWTRGRAFRAAIVPDRESPVREARQDGVRERYAVTAEPGVFLGYRAVFMRESDGALFRVASRGVHARPPRAATFDFVQFSAERCGPCPQPVPSGPCPQPVPKM